MNLIKGRKEEKKEGSYTTYLFEKGLDKILKKVGEETTEVIIAAKAEDKKETIYEIPAGKREKGEDPLETGKRELHEECGIIAENYIDLGKIYPSPGYTNEEIYLYAATGLTKVEQELDEDEFLQVTKMKLSTLIAKIMSGEITDAKTIAAAFKLKELRNKK